MFVVIQSCTVYSVIALEVLVLCEEFVNGTYVAIDVLLAQPHPQAKDWGAWRRGYYWPA